MKLVQKISINAKFNDVATIQTHFFCKFLQLNWLLIFVKQNFLVAVVDSWLAHNGNVFPDVMLEHRYNLRRNQHFDKFREKLEKSVTFQIMT